MNRSLFGLLLYWIVAVLAIVLITLWAAGLATASIADCIDATCRITAKDGGRGTGCAFERSQGYVYVLTAAHVVGDSQTVQCEFWRAGHQSSPLPATVIQRSPEADAAVVAVPESAFGGLVPKTIPVGPRDFVVRPGETVTSVGCANGTWSTGFRGHALGYEGSDLHFVPTPANGRSGSAIFDAEGRVIVGLLRARTGDDTQGIATSLQTLHAALAGQSQSEIRNLKSEITQCPGGSCPTPGSGNYQYRLLPDPQYRQYEQGRGEAYNQGRSNPWPTLPPASPSTPMPPIDLGPTNQRLDRITQLLEAAATPPRGPALPDPAGGDAARDAVEEAKEASAQAVAEVQEESSKLRQFVDTLIGDRGTLKERFDARLSKVQEELGEEASTREIARAYVKDLAQEKLSDPTLGLSAGKILGGALGLSGPLALGVGMGLWFLSRRIGSKIESGEPLLIQRVVERLGDKIDDLKDRVSDARSTTTQERKA